MLLKINIKNILSLLTILFILSIATQSIITSYYHEAPSTGESQVKEFVIRGEEFRLIPNAIWVDVGDTVRITFINDGSIIHGLAITGYEIATEILSPGQSETIEFTATREGIFFIYCPVGNHRELGMEGVLVVGFPEAETVTVTETETVIETQTETVEQTVTETVEQTVTVREAETITVTETIGVTVTERVTETVTETEVEMETVTETEIVERTVTTEVTRTEIDTVTQTETIIETVTETSTIVATGVIALIIGIALGTFLRLKR